MGKTEIYAAIELHAESIVRLCRQHDLRDDWAVLAMVISGEATDERAKLEQPLQPIDGGRA
jgi:hypothetical protein